MGPGLFSDNIWYQLSNVPRRAGAGQWNEWPHTLHLSLSRALSVTAPTSWNESISQQYRNKQPESWIWILLCFPDWKYKCGHGLSSTEPLDSSYRECWRIVCNFQIFLSPTWELNVACVACVCTLVLMSCFGCDENTERPANVSRLMSSAAS